MEDEIRKGNIITAEHLIDFAIKYPDKGETLSHYIWKSIRQAAGFTSAHSSILIPTYQFVYETATSRTIETPSAVESRESIEHEFVRAISGYYNKEFFSSLNINLDIDSNRYSDYGQKLLNHLNGKLPEVELDSQISFRKS